MTRTGKIARLPRVIRQELNERLANGVPGPDILKWVNALPEVQSAIHQWFEGQPINKKNLSDWRQGGFADWTVQEDALDQAGHMGEAGLPPAGPLTAQLSTVICTRYNRLLARWNKLPMEDLHQQLRAYESLCRQVTAVRRLEQNEVRLEMAQAKVVRDEGVTREQLIKLFESWLAMPGFRRRVLKLEATRVAEYRAKIEEMFGGGKFKWHTPEDYAKFGIIVKPDVFAEDETREGSEPDEAAPAEPGTESEEVSEDDVIEGDPMKWGVEPTAAPDGESCLVKGGASEPGAGPEGALAATPPAVAPAAMAAQDAGVNDKNPATGQEDSGGSKSEAVTDDSRANPATKVETVAPVVSTPTPAPAPAPAPVPRRSVTREELVAQIREIRRRQRRKWSFM